MIDNYIQQKEKSTVLKPSRSSGKNTQALLTFYAYGLLGKSAVLSTPKGNFLTPKAVENLLLDYNEEIRKEVEKLMPNERKVSYYGNEEKHGAIWQAESYGEKMLVRAVLDDVLHLLSPKEGDNHNKE